MFRSIRWKLTLSYVLLAVLTAAAFGFLSLVLIKNTVARQEKEFLDVTARSLAQQIEPFLDTEEDVQTLIDTMGFLSDVRISILDDSRRPLYQSSENFIIHLSAASHSPMEIELIEKRAPSLRDGGSPITTARVRDLSSLVDPMLSMRLSRQTHGFMGQRFFLEGLREGTLATVVQRTREDQPPSSRTALVPVGDVQDPVAYVQLSQGPDYGRQTIRTAFGAVILAAVGSVLIALIAGLMMSQKLTSPIVRLTSSVQAVKPDDMSVRVPESREDEIGQLARQFNRMADRLERSFHELTQERDTLRRFVEDASHELRTPVTALKTFNELLTSGGGIDDSNRKQFLLESQAQVARLEWIIRNLLDLSRLDGGLVSLDLEIHDAAEMVSASVQAVAPEAERKGIHVLIKTAGSGHHVTCDRRRIEIALVNLLDNGIKCSRPGQTIEIGWASEKNGTAFWVKDQGRGIDASDLPHIFDRFYRSRDAAEEGSGLGLAIVKSVVSAHGGSTSVQSEPRKGSTFSFRLPELGPETGHPFPEQVDPASAQPNG